MVKSEHSSIMLSMTQVYFVLGHYRTHLIMLHKWVFFQGKFLGAFFRNNHHIIIVSLSHPIFRDISFFANGKPINFTLIVQFGNA